MKAKKCPNCFGELNLSSISKYNGRFESHKRINVAYFCLGCKTVFMNPMFSEYNVVNSKILFKNQLESSSIKTTELEKLQPMTNL